MVRELIADSKERNDVNRETTEYVDERLGTPHVGERAIWAFSWSLNAKLREGCPTL